MFSYWYTVFNIELTILGFVGSLREGNFPGYKEALTLPLPFFFSSDRTHYSRWLTIHLLDMLNLKDMFPDVHEQFMDGKFVIHKSNRVYSGIAIDQAHEQNNAILKGEGGIIGITEDESSLLRWAVAGPEVCRVIKEYETISITDKTVNLKHHEETPSAQKGFKTDVFSLIHTIEEMGNPFLEESTTDLLTLDTKDVMDQKVTTMLKNYTSTGKKQCDNFVMELDKFYSPISRNKFTLFDTSTRKRDVKRVKVH